MAMPQRDDLIVVWPVTEMISMRAADIKAISDARASTPFEAIDTLVDRVEQASRRSWITLVANSIVGTILATALAVAVSRPIDGVQEKMRDLIHNLRGPISGILNKAQIAIDTKNCLMDALLSIKVKAESVLVTYDLNAEIARNHAGVAKEPTSEMDFSEIVNGLVEMFRVSADAKGLTLNCALPLEPVVVRSHRAKLARLVSNLIDNAVKYTDRGALSVTLEPRFRSVRLIVADTGIGMTRRTQRLMTTNFYRADASDEKPGAGIGIPLVFSTVTLYGGTFDCDSAPGKGTTITVTLSYDMTPKHPLLKRAFNRCRTWFTATRSAEQQEILDNPHNS